MIKYLNKSEFLKNVVILFSGSFFAQLIPFIVLPILQKFYYSPANFGLLAVFISFSELFSNVSCLKLEYGIVLQKKLKDAINLLLGSVLISLVIAIFAFVVVLVFKTQISKFLGEESIENMLFIIPLYILLVGFTDALSYWNNRKKHFVTLSSSKIIQSASAETTKILFGFLQLSTFGLIWGRVCGYAVSSFYFFVQFFRKDRKLLRMLSYPKSLNLIKENKSYIFFTTPSVFIGSLINLIYLNLFLYYFGQEKVGIIGVSMTYISAAYGVIAISFSQVFLSKISEIKTKKELLSVYLRFAKNLMLFSMIPLLIVFLIPSSLVTSVLGSEWENLIEIARIMCVWLSVWFVSSSLSFIYMRLGKQKTMLVFDFLHLLLIISGFYIGYFFDGTFQSALWGFTIAKLIFYILVIYLAIRFIKNCDESKL